MNVKITDVPYKNIRGTSITPEAINLSFSKSFPYEAIELENVNLSKMEIIIAAIIGIGDTIGHLFEALF